MSATTSATTGRRYGLKRVCRTWERSRSALYARRARVQRPARGDGPARRGPTPALSDAQLLAAIRTDLARSPFQGEGHRKVHARLRILDDIRVSRTGSGKMKRDPLSTRKQRLPGDDRRGETRSSRRCGQEDEEVIRMSQWAEVRHLHLVEGVSKKEIARRLQLDIKTVRRAVGRATPPGRVSSPRASSLDPWREQIEQWLREDRKLTAKRVRRLLLPLAGAVSPRTVRRYVAALRRAVTSKEAFVHRSMLPGTTMEVDFGESWVDISGVPCKVKYLVATLPYSNAYFAKAYPVERLESLLDGIESAFRYFGGVVDRVVLDNTSLAVKDILAGRDRVQTDAFEAFGGAYPFRAEFCAPAKGWVESGGKYFKRNFPMGRPFLDELDLNEQLPE